MALSNNISGCASLEKLLGCLICGADTHPGYVSVCGNFLARLGVVNEVADVVGVDVEDWDGKR